MKSEFPPSVEDRFISEATPPSLVAPELADLPSITRRELGEIWAELRQYFCEGRFTSSEFSELTRILKGRRPLKESRSNSQIAAADEPQDAAAVQWSPDDEILDAIELLCEALPNDGQQIEPEIVAEGDWPEDLSDLEFDPATAADLTDLLDTAADIADVADAAAGIAEAAGTASDWTGVLDFGSVDLSGFGE